MIFLVCLSGSQTKLKTIQNSKLIVYSDAINDEQQVQITNVTGLNKVKTDLGAARKQIKFYKGSSG